MIVSASPSPDKASPGGRGRPSPVLLATIRRFRDDERGASAIEYAVMAMFFSVTVIGGSSSIRNALLTAFTTVSSAVLSATNG